MSFERPDRRDGDSPPLRDWLALAAAGIGTILLLGVTAGFVAATLDHGMSRFGASDAAILAVILALTAGVGFAAWKLGRRLLGSGAHLPPRERQSRNVWLSAVAIGLVIGITLPALGLSDTADGALAIVSDTPIPPVAAIAFAILFAVLMPALSWHWHSMIDEHERDTYRVGAVAASYIFMCGAPAWWVLWRGGLMPPPNGVIIYFVFNFVFLAVWLWKKYR